MHLIETDRRHIWHPFTQEQTAPDPIAIVSAQGAHLTDIHGEIYLDMISSWWVTVHGHAHPAIAKAIAKQATQLEQVVFAGFTHPPAVQLAKRLTERLPSGLTRLFFSDNGSTAVEIALKLAAQYWINLGHRKRRVLAFSGGYHGETIGAMSAGKSSGFFKPFEPWLFQVDFLPFPETWHNDEEIENKERLALESLDRYLAQYADDTAALIIEPLVQGASGMRMCRTLFLQAVAERLTAYGVLLIFDEVMTGFGRTGALFACLKAGVTPDFICLAKGMSGGFLPLAATVCREEIYQAFLGESFDKAFAHGHSFTANPLGCAAALASLELFEKERTLQRIAAMERYHTARLEELSQHLSVQHTRVTGSIAALEIATTGKQGYTATIGSQLKNFFMSKKVLIRPLGNTIYLMPPYCVEETDLSKAYDAIAEALIQIQK